MAASANTIACPGAAAASAPDTSNASTLYQRLGGAAAVEAAVGIFYQRIVQDQHLAPFFEGVDMEKQRRKQVAFMSYVFGGASGYEGRDLAAAHRRLILEQGLNTSHFDRVAEHLSATLLSLGVSQDLHDEAMAIVATAKPAIFGAAA